VALFTPDLDLFDLQRFEVLRGPQGTLFGSGSISGVLRYITAQPELGMFGGTVEASASTGTDSEFGGAIKGMLNVPVGDTSALRIVGYHDELPGFIDSVYPGRGKRELRTNIAQSDVQMAKEDLEEARVARLVVGAPARRDLELDVEQHGADRRACGCLHRDREGERRHGRVLDAPGAPHREGELGRRHLRKTGDRHEPSSPATGSASAGRSAPACRR